MAQLLALAIQILARVIVAVGLVQTVLGLAKAVHDLLNPPSGVNTFTQTAQRVSETRTIIGDPVYGLPMIETLIDMNQSALLAAIAACQQAANPVILPTTPPLGYAQQSVDGVPSDVWSFVYLDGTDTTGEYLNHAGESARNRSFKTAERSPESAYFRLVYDWATPGVADPPLTPPVLDVTAILPDDTIGTWANRVAVGGETYFQTDGGAWASGDFFAAPGWYEIDLTDAEFDELKRLANPGTLRGTPPIWPGLANVTLGTPVALAAGLTITTPMDGVLVSIATVPPGTGIFIFDDVDSWRYIGGLSFFSDDGDQEFPQNLGFSSAVYSPKEMARAAGVKIRCKLGVTGTVTPWRVV